MNRREGFLRIARSIQRVDVKTQTELGFSSRKEMKSKKTLFGEKKAGLKKTKRSVPP